MTTKSDDTRGDVEGRRSAERPLSGRRALVTGGGRGIGQAIALRLSALGADLVITYRSDLPSAEAVADRCRQADGASVRVLLFDTADPGGPAGLLDALDVPIDVLVLNAAAPYPKAPLVEIPAAVLTGKVGQDLGVMHQLVTGLVPGMVDRGFGRVVVIGSLHAEGPSAPGMAANGVSKAALAGYVEYAVDELTGPGVTINTVHPGYVATEASGHLQPAVPALMESLTPAGRLGRPDDVAGVVAMLARPESEFVNGARIPVSGGLNHPVAARRILSW